MKLKRSNFNGNLLITLLSLSTFSAVAQVTITLQPDAQNGKDAYLRSLSPDDNFGVHPDFSAHVGTAQGVPVTVRGIIEFDLSSIPTGATVDAAYLSLYSYNSTGNGSHSQQSGSNETSISRVLSSWDESTVTWNNQPSTSTQNQVLLPATTSSIQHYPNIDVTGMVQDMVTDPNTGHGFLFQLLTESGYRKMLFASSDNADSTLHPKLVVTYTEPAVYEGCLTLQPDAELGKDAYLRSLSPDDNYGNNPDFSAHSGTALGEPVQVRGIIDFDLSGVPSGSTIDSAFLSLYSYNSNGNGSHLTQSGSNEALLSRVLAPWHEDSVTWNNQPPTTNQNQIYMPATTASIQHYLDIDITAMVQDMIDHPDSAHGILFQLITESGYRKMLFASSDNSDSSLHPRLDICFTAPADTTDTTDTSTGIVNVDDHPNAFSLYPNPSTDVVQVRFTSEVETNQTLEIVDQVGQIVYRNTAQNGVNQIQVSDYQKGLYFVRTRSSAGLLTKPLLIQ